MPYLTCAELYNCCDCGGYDCGCNYCWSCHACEACQNDDGPCEEDPGA